LLTRVLVVDDYPPFRSWVSTFLRDKLDLKDVIEASDGQEAVTKAEELQPELIILDIRLPNLNGIEAARQIRRVAPESRIIFLSQETSADVVQEAIESGGSGYVTKASAATDLLKAIGAVLQSKLFISKGVGDNPNTEEGAAD
jgi:DNA-binding NarL/FixJ family response regulator